MPENIPSECFSIEHYALQIRNDTITDFDTKNENQLSSTLSQLQQLLTIKLVAAAEGGINTQAQFQAFSVIKRVLDVLVSAVQMARQRADIEVLILLRVALEAGSTALQISRDEEVYQQYVIGRYNSPKAITFAKGLLPVIGEVYGHLSKTAVHTNQVAYGPLAELDENLTFEFIIREHLPIQDSILLSFISLVAVIVLKITELVLLKEDDSLKGWFQLPGTRMKYLSNSDKRIAKYLDAIKAAPKMAENGQV